MKTGFIFRMNLLFISLLLFNGTFAQQDIGRQSVYGTSSRKNNIESPFVAKNLANETVAVTTETIKHFNKRFHNPANVIWEQMDYDNFLATFIKDDITTKTLFNKTGRLIYAIRFSAGKELPNEVRDLIIRNYSNYTVTSAAKVEQDDRKIWVINLAGTKNYITARVEDGEIEETENFTRAN